MGKFKIALALAASGLMMAAAPVAAAGRNLDDATTLRRLDMMLMATSLGCRFGASDFRVEYDQFRIRFLPSLRDAALAVTADLSSRLGQRGATDAFDKMSVRMANHYGAGHPALNCAQLKQATATLAKVPNETAVLAMAAQLLHDGDGAAAVLARR